VTLRRKKPLSVSLLTDGRRSEVNLIRHDSGLRGPLVRLFPGSSVLHSVSSGRMLDVSSDSVQDESPIVIWPAIVSLCHRPSQARGGSVARHESWIEGFVEYSRGAGGLCGEKAP
jgi:hypothetical protein